MNLTYRWASLVLPTIAITTAAFAGDKQALPVKPADDAYPLSFFDGALTIDFQERLRFESRENNRDFNDSAHDDNDDNWFLNRFRFGISLKPSPWLKAYVQTQDAREAFSDRPNIPGVHSAEGNDIFDLRQAYLQIGNTAEFPLSLTVGRKPLQYGDRRLIGDSLWSNLGKTFDQVTLRYESPKLWVDAFAARPVQQKTGEFDDNDAADNLFGLYASTTYIPHQTTDLYFIYRDKSDNQPDLSPTNALDPVGTGNGPAARFATIGTRIDSKPGELHGWDYQAEFAYEFGDVWQSDRLSKKYDLSAFAAHVQGGYTFEQASWRPRIGLEYDYASGDSNPNDSKSSSFQNLFPGNHEKYGFMDEFSWRNLHDARVQFNIRPTKKIDIELDYHAFWLADTGDYWYRSNGLTALRTATPSGQDVRTVGANQFAGHEVDLTVTYEATKYLKLQGGYSHFFAGSYLVDTGPHDDADFAYFMATLQF